MSPLAKRFGWFLLSAVYGAAMGLFALIATRRVDVAWVVGFVVALLVAVVALRRARSAG